jgi:hypothetical protein
LEVEKSISCAGNRNTIPRSPNPYANHNTEWIFTAYNTAPNSQRIHHILWWFLTTFTNRSGMATAVSRRALTAETQALFQAVLFCFCGPGATGTDFLLLLGFSPVSVILPVPHIFHSWTTDAQQPTNGQRPYLQHVCPSVPLSSIRKRHQTVCWASTFNISESSEHQSKDSRQLS